MIRLIRIASIFCLTMLTHVCQANNLEHNNSKLITDLLNNENFKIDLKTNEGIPVKISSRTTKYTAENLIAKITSENTGFVQIGQFKFLSNDKILLSYSQSPKFNNGIFTVEYIGYTGKYESASKDKKKYYPHVKWAIIGDTDISVLEEYIRKNQLSRFTYDINFDWSDVHVIGVATDVFGFPGESNSVFSFSKITGRLVELEIKGKSGEGNINVLQEALKETYASQTDCSILSFSEICKRYYTIPLTDAEIEQEPLGYIDPRPRVVLSKVKEDTEYNIAFLNEAGYMVDDKEINKIIERFSKTRRKNIDEIKQLFK